MSYKLAPNWRLNVGFKFGPSRPDQVCLIVGCKEGEFNWSMYVKNCRGQLAPKHLFKSLNTVSTRDTIDFCLICEMVLYSKSFMTYLFILLCSLWLHPDFEQGWNWRRLTGRTLCWFVWRRSLPSSTTACSFILTTGTTHMIIGKSLEKVWLQGCRSFEPI